MPWFYTDISIIAPPKRFIVPNHKLWFEIALLELHAWFTAGDNERGKLEAMEIAMFQYLANGQNSSPPQDFTQWLCNVYTGMAPFNKVTLADIEMYHEGVSMNGENTLSPGWALIYSTIITDWRWWLVGPGQKWLIPFITKIKETPLYIPQMMAPSHATTSWRSYSMSTWVGYSKHQVCKTPH